MKGVQPAKISLSNVEKRFISAQGVEQTALSHVDLDIDCGEFVCLVGPSGCGKTTLVNLMAGFDQPSSGAVFIDGKAVTGPNPDHIVIFQDYGLFPWKSVLENVQFGLMARGFNATEVRKQALASLDLVDMSASADKHPHELSGGMKQRVAIARALAVEPSVLFMDEPFAALDVFSRLRLQDELLHVWEKKRPTVVLVTNDLDEAIQVAQKVVLLTPGPGRIQRILDVSLSYPRNRTQDDFTIFRRKLYEEFHLAHQQMANDSAPLR